MEEANLGYVNEKDLFHGTLEENISAITRKNFDVRVSGKNATRFGEGK